MLINRNKGLTGALEIGIVVAVVVLIGLVVWRVASSDDPAASVDDTDELAQIAELENWALANGLDLATIDTDSDGIPECVPELEEDDTVDFECETEDEDNDHDNDGIPDEDDDDHDHSDEKESDDSDENDESDDSDEASENSDSDQDDDSSDQNSDENMDDESDDESDEDDNDDEDEEAN